MATRRPSTRAYVRAVRAHVRAGKAFGSAGSLQLTAAVPTPPSTASTAAADASPAAAGGYADQTEVNSLKRKVEVLQQAIITHQRHDAENAAIKQRLAGKRMLLDSSALQRAGLTWYLPVRLQPRVALF